MSDTVRARTTPPSHDLARQLFEARSVAVVGASGRPGSVGAVALSQLVDGGFTGRYHPVNPRYDELAGEPCLPSLLDLPQPVDLVVLAVPDAALEEQLRLASTCGARAAVIFGGFSAVSEAGVDGTLSDRLGTIARSSGMALCGPNGMGFIDFRRQLRAVGYDEPLTRVPGSVTLLSQSGSVFSALLHNTRNVEFDLVVSTGQEASLSVVDYMLHALDRDSTDVIALFLETVRDGPAFAGALSCALDRDVPVVALKVGSSSAAEHLVRAHSGGLAGDDGAYEALFDAYGVSRVRTLDELLDTVELFRAGRRASTGGLATLHDSGGERALVADLAEQEGIPFARISETTSQRLQGRLDPGLLATNPLDAWGSGHDFEAAFRDHLVALHDDPDTAVVAFAVDLTSEPGDDVGYVRVAREVSGLTHKPFAVLANLASGIDAHDAARIRSAGVPVLEGTSTGLAAIHHLLDRRDVLVRPALEPTPLPDLSVRSSWRQRLETGGPFSEADGLAMLRDYGFPVVDHRTASSSEEALSAAEELGWPVALKTAVLGIDHKTEVAGVHLDLTGPDQLMAAYERLCGLGPAVQVSRMVPGTVEFALGLVRDAQFGPVLVVGAGGTLVEVLDDRRVALPPVDAYRAHQLLERLAMRPLYAGVRGRPPIDVTSVVDAVVALSALAEDLGPLVDALDINPLRAGPDGCRAVDALVVPRLPNAALRAGGAQPPA